MKSFAYPLGILALTVGVLKGDDAKTKVDLSKLPPAAARTIDFQRDIEPLFAKACVSCHGPEKQRSGLRLDRGTEALKGGDSGEVIKPGDAVHSRLLLMVAGLDADAKMPPEGKKPLTAEEIGLLRAWIDQGAKWPKDAGAVVSQTPKSNHWAFQPIRRPAVPTVRSGQAGIRNPIDAFVRARLEAEKIAPAPEADRGTLLRRLSFDLLGLPPTPEEVEAVGNDTSPDWYERLVERLLASPHYGERWGRHWLDLARYADSDGFEKDTGRPHAWRYRHWVIQALNRDLPFDQFTLEQLAGDLLPNATTEQKVATGFHRNTLTNKEGGVDREQFRVEQVVDRVSTTAKVFLGITLNCCQCHDHKYDPFSQREFYQFFAFFNNDNEVDIPAPIPGDQEVYNKRKVVYDKKLAELQAAVTAYTKEQLPANLQKWEQEIKPEERQKLPANIVAILQVTAQERNDKQRKELADYYAKTDKKLVALNKAVTDQQKTAPTVSMAQTLTLGQGRKTHVLMRGDFLRPGVEVRTATPAVLPAPPTGGRDTSASGAGTRLELAQWIVDPANPLTARVIVNWMWHRYFGRGIVPTLEDFGTQGEKPSHPELLDYLASEFMRQKWSLKALHKLIVTSATYRQSSKTRPELAHRDPLNVLLARQNRLRLEAELVRDNALAVSGLLTRTVGGPSVRPPQPAGISELTYAGSAKWVESTGPDRYRRGLYTWFQRTSPYPMLMTFDSPDSNVSCVRRERSNTPLQALTLLNDTSFVECAQALGLRLVTERPAGSASERLTEERIRHAYRLGLAREPSAKELAVLMRLYEDLLKNAQANPEAAAKLVGPRKPAGVEIPEVAAWVALARTVMNLDEFVTKE